MELLKELYRIYSPSGNEKRMRKFISAWVKNNIPQATIGRDQTGNLYITKGVSETYPCVVAHMDQVQHIHSRDFGCIEDKGVILGYSQNNKRQEGLGADDKNGIWVALKCLAKFDVLKCVFFVQEEAGCIGSARANMPFFENCRFVLQCDRKNGGDLITAIGGWTELCSPEFLADIDNAEFGYRLENGMITDVGMLKDNGLGVSAINLSCGYYNPHTDYEFTIVDELVNCLHFVEHIIEKCTKVYPHLDRDIRYASEYEKEDEYAELQYLIEDQLYYSPESTDEDILRNLDGMYLSVAKDEIVQMISDIRKRDYL